MASFIMAGRGQAALFIILSTLMSLILPPLGIFSGAAIALVSLRIGWQQGLVYSLLGSAVLAIAAYLLKQDAPMGLIAGLVGWLPVVFFASILTQTRSWQSTLQAVLIVTIGGVILFHVFQPDTAAYWQTWLEQAKPALKESYQLTEQQIGDLIINASTWMTGIFAAGIALSAVIALLLARHWQAMLYNPGGFAEEFRELRIGFHPAVAVILCIFAVIVSKNPLAVEILIIAVGIFMIQGVALVHSIIHQLGMKPGWIIGLYILLFVLLVQMVILLAAFGIIDNFVDFRKKLSARSDQN